MKGAAVIVFRNPRVDRVAEYPAQFRAVLSHAAGHEAWAAVRKWTGYAPTPLVDLASLAREVGVAQLLIKDEGQRFELRSFKALGGAYAVERLAAERRGEPLTVTCATDGNHGRAVAWGARKAGIQAVIYIHEGVTQGRATAIASFGAEVRRRGRTYDDSVRICAEDAAANGWQIVSDTSWPGYTDVPRMVTQGYALMAAEALQQGAKPTHVFLQGGVGAMAAGVLAWLWEAGGRDRPVAVVVEPEAAACLYESAKAGTATTVGGDLDTVMAGLACGEPSLIAWPVLERGADAFMTISDAQAIAAMTRLADEGVVIGESGVAGLAGFLALANDKAAREALCLTGTSRVLCFGTEGATDPDVYMKLVGRAPEAVARRA